MEHRSLIWGLDDGWMGDGISSLGDNLSSDNVRCGRQDVNTLVCRIGIACISFCLCLCICICLCLWLVIRYSQVTCGGSKICSPWCTIGIARIPFITTWWAGGTPCRAVKHYLSPQVTQIDCYHPRHPFHIVSMIILIIGVVNVITWKGENVERIWLLSGVVRLQIHLWSYF